MRQMKTLYFHILLAMLFGCAEDPADVSAAGGANLILTNARVYTLNWDEPGLDGSVMANAPFDDGGWHPDAEAIVTQGGEIIFVGRTRDAMEYQGESSRIIDLAGATVIPGLVDSHTHVFELGERIDRVNLVDAKTEEDAVALIVERAKVVPDGEWIVFASNRNSPALSGQLWLIRPDGTGLRQMTFGDWGHTQPSWSFSGESVVAYRFQETSDWEYGGIAVIRVDAER